MRLPPAVAVLAAVLAVLPACDPAGRVPVDEPPVTAVPLAPGPETSMEFLGNPFQKPAYARNVWDIQAFDGKVWFGHGNSSNNGPYANAGPVPVISFDPRAPTPGFTTEYVVPEEQIDTYRILNGALYLPGHDPRGPDEPGNFYRLDPDGFTQRHTVPGGVHVYDMAYFGGALFAATGGGNATAVVTSTNLGESWEGVLFDPARIYSLFEFGGLLYAQGDLAPATVANEYSFHTYVFDGARFVRSDITRDQLAPEDRSNSDLLRLTRPTPAGAALLYIVAETINDHQWRPLGLGVYSGTGAARAARLPAGGALPRDILVRAKTTYVLASVEQGAGGFINFVYSTTDLRTWTERIRFSTDSFARSFEELDGAFYFGLGCDDPASCSEVTGDLLRARPG